MMKSLLELLREYANDVILKSSNMLYVFFDLLHLEEHGIKVGRNRLSFWLAGPSSISTLKKLTQCPMLWPQILLFNVNPLSKSHGLETWQKK